ncbi:MAG: glycosyltransferase group 2 family protein [Candidatus Paraimprobicoccus trichonymphae]|uniref:Glycosyltransferase group 2 family protein n=1 Tax=Candidatus Paraimprobicoccus trichonymphae TaxID=3033793 RepID=A0AA48HWD6_9FIRM|nr:MAG: glycosyltransferase group 2 family protein [Candidatus Paraimprobicoccus trichonymphae]
MPEISIVIPVYNTDKYLKSCLDSVLAQNFKDFELIIVNDGSIDNSLKICKNYKKKDKRIKLIDKKNNGVGSARNIGIDISNSKYIGFVDSDDYIDSDMYEFLYGNLKKYNSDISICGICNLFFSNNKIIKKNQSKIITEKCFNNKEAFKEILESKLFSVNPVNKLFKKSLFENIRFPEKKTAEDAFTIPEVILKSKKVIYNSKAKYNYVRRQNSITTSNFNLRDLDVIDAYKKHFVTIKSEFPEYIKQGEFRYLWSHIYILDKFTFSEKISYDIEYNYIVKKLEKSLFSIISNPYFSLKRKFMMVIFFINKNLYKKILLKFTF